MSHRAGRRLPASAGRWLRNSGPVADASCRSSHARARCARWSLGRGRFSTSASCPSRTTGACAVCASDQDHTEACLSESGPL
eukprot:6840391-Alexandrium_andersonii.AAC.1